jgi:ABC-type antimicrobial peptide transport system ATPase subunit
MGATPGKESSEDYEKRAIKILSIGIHCSGKSTFARHVRGMFHPPTENEINNYRNILMQNLFLGIGNIVQRAEDIEYSFDEEIAKVRPQQREELLLPKTDSHYFATQCSQSNISRKLTPMTPKSTQSLLRMYV